MRAEGWLEAQLTTIFKESPRRGKRRFLGNETRSWEVADIRLDEAAEHMERTLSLLELVYETYWQYIGEQPGDPDGPELIDVFDSALDPLDPWEHQRLVVGDAVKEAVSVAEVYLDDLARHIPPHIADGVPRRTLKEALERHSFPKLISGYDETFDLDLRAKPYWSEWNEVRATRHLLTHNWGRYNPKYFTDAVRQPDTYTPRLDEDGYGPRDAGEAKTTTARIALDADYARRALAIARSIVDEIEAELGEQARRAGIDWYS